jgi:hypothetical protein
MMRRIGVLAVAAFAICAGAAYAQEVAEGGWINLFDKESLFGWNLFGDAKWQVTDGIIEAKEGTGGWLATTSEFADFELAVKIRIKGKGTTALLVRAPIEGYPAETGGMIVLDADQGGDWHDINVKAIGNDVKATVDGKPVEISAKQARGHIGFAYTHRQSEKGHSDVAISEAKLRPLKLASIFNGKDLSGWNPIPGHQSVFSVADGSLNIKNGNGQIETAGTYKDFLLQVDILCNGEKKPLNSGVFFRGPVGVFWKGYESQVRNEYVKDHRDRPIDFGTGGLYGVQNSRKVVTDEKKWFQKTMVIDGNHFAIWLDGYQVCDYYDTRAISPDSNGKEGFVPGPGTIHLQGHDPTTDMFFKNINIQDWSEK